MSDFDNPKRWQPPKNLVRDSPAGTYQPGILDPHMALLYGSVISQWTHIEDWMVEVLEWLIFVDEKIIHQVAAKSRGHTPGIQILRAISNHSNRMRLMKTLLSGFMGNLKKDALYDEIIERFGSLGGRRNDFVHSKWWTHESGRVFMQKHLTETLAFGLKEEVTAEDFTSFTRDVAELQKKIHALSWIEHREIREELLASLPQTPPQPP